MLMRNPPAGRNFAHVVLGAIRSERHGGCQGPWGEPEDSL